MYLFYIMIFLFRFSALYLVGGQTQFLLWGNSTFPEALAIYGLALVMWLMSMLFDYILGHPKQPKFLNTKMKRIIAAAVCLIFGFASFMWQNGLTWNPYAREIGKSDDYLV